MPARASWCWKRAAATTGSGTTFRSAIFAPSAIRAPTGCSQTEKEPGLNGRSLNYPRGKVIGGSSAINGMISMRGQAQDYDHWRQLGLTGWGWDDVRPVFKRLDNHFLGATEHHGAEGEWRVEQPRVRWDVLDAVARAANEMGIPTTSDFNTGDNTGVGYFHVNQKRGLRWSAARAFLKPVLGRANLRLETGVLVEKVLFEGKRAIGVQFRQNGRLFEARAKGEVILSAGAVASPLILQLSGVGPADWLTELGIPTVARQARASAATCRTICSSGRSSRSTASRR